MSASEQVEGRLVDALAAWAELVVPEATGSAGPTVPPRVLALLQPSGPTAGEEAEDLDLHPSSLAPLRARPQVVALAAVAAAVLLLVAGTVVGVRALRPDRADPALRVGHLLSVFDRPATRSDRLPADVLDAPGADYRRSRYLGEVQVPRATPKAGVEARARYWTAVDSRGRICFITRIVGGGGSSGCVTPREFARSGGARAGLPVGSGATADSLMSRLVPDHGAVRRLDRGEERVLPNVITSYESDER